VPADGPIDDKIPGDVRLAESRLMALLRPSADHYVTVEESPEDILPIVEVADRSEAYDRLTKAPLYARFGIQGYRIVNINREQVVAYRDPTPHGYSTTQVSRRSDTIGPLAFPDLTIRAVDFLG
jgi:Uma2 family endonuclease